MSKIFIWIELFIIIIPITGLFIFGIFMFSFVYIMNFQIFMKFIISLFFSMLSKPNEIVILLYPILFLIFFTVSAISLRSLWVLTLSFLEINNIYSSPKDWKNCRYGIYVSLIAPFFSYIEIQSNNGQAIFEQLFLFFFMGLFCSIPLIHLFIESKRLEQL